MEFIDHIQNFKFDTENFTFHPVREGLPAAASIYWTQERGQIRPTCPPSDRVN